MPVAFGRRVMLPIMLDLAQEYPDLELTLTFRDLASPAYLAAHGTSQTLEEVESHRAIVGHRRAQPLSWRVSQERRSFRYFPPATHQLSDGEAIIHAAVAGLGLMQLPLPEIRQELQEGKLVTVLDD